MVDMQDTPLHVRLQPIFEEAYKSLGDKEDKLQKLKHRVEVALVLYLHVDGVAHEEPMKLDLDVPADGYCGLNAVLPRGAGFETLADAIRQACVQTDDDEESVLDIVHDNCKWTHGSDFALDLEEFTREIKTSVWQMSTVFPCYTDLYSLVSYLLGCVLSYPAITSAYIPMHFLGCLPAVGLRSPSMALKTGKRSSAGLQVWRSLRTLPAGLPC